MKQKWKKAQYVELSMDEIFCFLDKLDMVKDEPEKVWEVVEDLLMEMEAQLELSPNFLKQLAELDLEKDFVPLDVDRCNELFEEDEDFEANYVTAQDYVNYIMYVQAKQKVESDDRLEHLEAVKEIASENKYDIPFMPRLDF